MTKPNYGLYGALLGLATGTAITLVKRQQAERKHRDLVAEAKATAAEIKAVQVAAKRVQQSLHTLQQAKDEQVMPFVADMQQEVRAYQFKLAPHLDKLNKSMETLNATVSETTTNAE